MIWTTFVLAVRQLSRNKSRTALTSLGILIGVAAVIVMVSIGRGATQAVEDDLAGLGQNLLFVTAGTQGRFGPGAMRPFAESDVAAVRELPGVAGAVAINQRSVVAAAGEETWRTSVTGTNADYLTVLQWEIAAGRSFESGEELAGSDVCLLGETVATALFGSQEPLDQVVRMDKLTCRVVGRLSPKGQNTFGQDQDDFVIVPLRTFQRRLQGNRDVTTIFVSAAEGARTEAIKSELEALMRQRRAIRAGAEPDFTVRDMAEITDMLSGVSAVLTAFLAAVAAVSLLVGGIGIMNIMLVSVTERTREIGIRLAVGALPADVLLQFLVESVVLSAVGGVAGIGLGLGVSWGAALALDLPLVIDPFVVLGAFVFSAVIGVVFGFFPARRAARLRPIDALRHE
ncbi:MAG: putative ABC transport system permease protein [Myxococcota bacterium]|jgi:putative ABC transport system permease protein